MAQRVGSLRTQTEHAMPILKRHRKNVLCFNDDIQGTAVVVLAGIYGAMAAQGKSKRHHRANLRCVRRR